MSDSNQPPSGRRPRQDAALLPGYHSVERQIEARLRQLLGGASIRRVAAMIGYNHETLRRALRGNTIPLEAVVRLCAHYRMSADWVLFGVGEGPAEGGPIVEVKGLKGAAHDGAA